MMENYELKMVLKETAVECIKVILQNFCGETEENSEISQAG
jgi:hypothetical protein